MVHLLSALVPNVTLRLPGVLSADQVAAAQKAFDEAQGLIRVKTPMNDALASLADAKSARANVKAFAESQTAFRNALYDVTCKDPTRRILIHQAVMGAGFYKKVTESMAGNNHNAHQEIFHTYNFDLRRDDAILRSIHHTVKHDKTATDESNETLSNVLLLERRLFGQNRFHEVAGLQYLVMGVPFKDIETEKELDRILALEPVRQSGNFIKSYDDPDPELKDAHVKRWKHAVVKCGPEEQQPYQEACGNAVPANELPDFRLRILKPAPPVPFWSRFRQKLLELWVMFFTFWAMFFMVDEEILTLIGLIVTKWKQTRIMKEEAEKAGNAKIYVVRGYGF